MSSTFLKTCILITVAGEIDGNVTRRVVPLNEFLRIDAALSAATEQLQTISESPRLDAELLLARALDVQRSYLFAHPEQEMDPAAATRFTMTIAKRVDGMPMAYISGEKEFWSMTLQVNPETLVPRPETEILVDQALICIPRQGALQILDLGTGSGAIALALARERPGCNVVATDLSDGALAVARENARQLNLPNIEFRQGTWIEPVSDLAFDIIVSNPPYIASNDPHLRSLQYEPRDALESGEDGLDAIRQITATAGAVMTASGKLLLEHGCQQAEAVAAILQKSGWVDIHSVKDLAGLPRVTIATR